jgi:hypothetical protein
MVIIGEFCHHIFCRFTPFAVVRFVFLYVLSWYVMSVYLLSFFFSLYTFCLYKFCLLIPFVFVRFVVILFVVIRFVTESFSIVQRSCSDFAGHTSFYQISCKIMCGFPLLLADLQFWGGPAEESVNIPQATWCGLSPRCRRQWGCSGSRQAPAHQHRPRNAPPGLRLLSSLCSFPF